MSTAAVEEGVMKHKVYIVSLYKKHVSSYCVQCLTEMKLNECASFVRLKMTAKKIALISLYRALKLTKNHRDTTVLVVDSQFLYDFIVDCVNLTINHKNYSSMINVVHKIEEVMSGRNLSSFKYVPQCIGRDMAVAMMMENREKIVKK